MLEQVHLARFLGPQVNMRFFRAMHHKAWGTLQRQGVNSILHNAFGVVLHAEAIRNAMAINDFNNFSTQISIFLQHVEPVSLQHVETFLYVKSLDIRAYSPFEALVSVFEFTATYLLSLINPGNAVALPWSWAALHLPAIMNARHLKSKDMGDQGIYVYGSCLLSLTSSFCRIVSLLERAVSQYGFNFGCGRPVAFMRRWNFDFLTTVILNLANWPNLLRGLAGVLTQAQATLSLLTAPGSGGISSLKKLQDDLVGSFRSYNGKDRMCVITLDDKATHPFYLSSFVEKGARVTKSSDIIKECQGIGEAVSASDEKRQDMHSKSEKDKYMGFNLDIIVHLQRRWRIILTRIHQQRRARETLHSQILISIQKLCSVVLDGERGNRAFSDILKIHIRALLFTQGINVLIEIDKATRTIRAVRDSWKAAIERPLTISEIEVLDSITPQIGNVESKLSNLMEMWSLHGFEKHILRTSPEEWRAGAHEAVCALKSIKYEVDAVERKLASTAESGA